MPILSPMPEKWWKLIIVFFLDCFAPLAKTRIPLGGMIYPDRNGDILFSGTVGVSLVDIMEIAPYIYSTCNINLIGIMGDCNVIIKINVGLFQNLDNEVENKFTECFYNYLIDSYCLKKLLIIPFLYTKKFINDLIRRKK